MTQLLVADRLLKTLWPGFGLRQSASPSFKGLAVCQAHLPARLALSYHLTVLPYLTTSDFSSHSDPLHDRHDAGTRWSRWEVQMQGSGRLTMESTNLFPLSATLSVQPYFPSQLRQARHPAQASQPWLLSTRSFASLRTATPISRMPDTNADQYDRPSAMPSWKSPQLHGSAATYSKRMPYTSTRKTKSRPKVSSRNTRREEDRENPCPPTRSWPWRPYSLLLKWFLVTAAGSPIRGDCHQLKRSTEHGWSLYVTAMPAVHSIQARDYPIKFYTALKMQIFPPSTIHHTYTFLRWPRKHHMSYTHSPDPSTQAYSCRVGAPETRLL